MTLPLAPPVILLHQVYMSHSNLSPNTVRTLQQEFQWSLALLCQLGVKLPPLAAPNFGGNSDLGAEHVLHPVPTTLAHHSSASTPVATPLGISSPAPQLQQPIALPLTQLNFPSILAPPPLSAFTPLHPQPSSALANPAQHQIVTGSFGTLPTGPSPTASLTAPVPAAFRRGIPSGGYPTTSVNTWRASSSSVVWNAPNSQWQNHSQPYEVLNTTPPISCLGISGSHINLLEVLLFPSKVCN